MATIKCPHCEKEIGHVDRCVKGVYHDEVEFPESGGKIQPTWNGEGEFVEGPEGNRKSGTSAPSVGGNE